MVLKQMNPTKRYILDSFPVSMCKNIRISRSKLVKSELFRGKCVSKKGYFYERVFLWSKDIFNINREENIPVKVAFLPGSYHDIRGLQALPLEFCDKSEIVSEVVPLQITILKIHF